MQTIFSTVTNPNNSAICIIRISGNSFSNLENFIPSLKNIKHSITKRAKILDENFEVLDDAMITYFQAPKSFTGENILEISLHASKFIVGKFLEILAKIPNFRFAKNGEFCLRAVKNNKISLYEAEAINKLICSESLIQHKCAMAEMNGSSKNFVNEIKAKILKILSLLETFIDFSEEEAIFLNLVPEIKNINYNLLNTIKKMLSFSKKNNDYDLQIAILGKPNVGKSTLFNTIIGEENAIVSSIAGTTRDIIRKIINISGFKIELIDTAGIRNATEEIEMIGIKKAKEIATNADIIIHLQDNTPSEIDLSTHNGIILDVFTKNDIIKYSFNNQIFINNKDISQLEKALYIILNERFLQIQGIGFIGNERQKSVLSQTINILQNIDFTQNVEIISENFRHALHIISFLIGNIDTEEVLGEIFSNFCIGK